MHSRSVDNPSQIYAKLGKSCRTSAVAVSHLAPVLESSLAYFECPCSPFATAHGSVSLLGLALRASLGHFLRAIRSATSADQSPPGLYGRLQISSDTMMLMRCAVRVSMRKRSVAASAKVPQYAQDTPSAHYNMLEFD